MFEEFGWNDRRRTPDNWVKDPEKHLFRAKKIKLFPVELHYAPRNILVIYVAPELPKLIK